MNNLYVVFGGLFAIVGGIIILNTNMFSLSVKEKTAEVQETTSFFKKAKYYPLHKDKRSDLSKAYESLDFHTLDKSPCSQGDLSTLWIGERYIMGLNKRTDDCISVFNEEGRFLTGVNIRDALDEAESLSSASISINFELGIIYIGSSKKMEISSYDFSGKLLNRKSTGFSFLSFEPSVDGKKFLFFCPSQALQNKPTIRLTDFDFQLIKELFPLPRLVGESGFLSANHFKSFENKVFFNPPLTNDIFEIGFDGEVSGILSGIPVQEKLVDLVLDARGDPFYFQDPAKLTQLRERKYFTDFLVNDSYVLLKGFQNGKYLSTLIERKSGRVLIHQNGTPLADFGPSFKFVFQPPRSTSKDRRFFFWLTRDQYQSVLKEVSKNQAETDISNLPEIDQNIGTVIGAFEYGFDEMFNKSDLNVQNYTENGSNKEEGFVIEEVHFSVFPNPARDHISVSFSINDDVESSSLALKMYDLTGRIVKAKDIQVGKMGLHTTTVEISGVSEGTYLCVLTDKNGKILGKQTLVKVN